MRNLAHAIMFFGAVTVAQFASGQCTSPPTEVCPTVPSCAGYEPVPPGTSAADVQALLDAYGYVRLGHGTFEWDEPVVIHSRQKLEGSGAATVITGTDFGALDYGIVLGDPNDSCSMFDAEVANVLLYGTAIRIRTMAQSCRLHRVTVNGQQEEGSYFPVYGILFDDADGEGLILDQCIARECDGGCGIFSYTHAINAVKFVNCNFQHNLNSGLDVATDFSGQIDGLVFDGCIIQGNHGNSQADIRGFVTNSLWQDTWFEWFPNESNNHFGISFRPNDNGNRPVRPIFKGKNYFYGFGPWNYCERCAIRFCGVVNPIIDEIHLVNVAAETPGDLLERVDNTSGTIRIPRLIGPLLELGDEVSLTWSGGSRSDVVIDNAYQTLEYTFYEFSDGSGTDLPSESTSVTLTPESADGGTTVRWVQPTTNNPAIWAPVGLMRNFTSLTSVNTTPVWCVHDDGACD